DSGMQLGFFRVQEDRAPCQTALDDQRYDLERADRDLIDDWDLQRAEVRAIDGVDVGESRGFRPPRERRRAERRAGEDRAVEVDEADAIAFDERVSWIEVGEHPAVRRAARVDAFERVDYSMTSAADIERQLACPLTYGIERLRLKRERLSDCERRDDPSLNACVRRSDQRGVGGVEIDRKRRAHTRLHQPPDGSVRLDGHIDRFRKRLRRERSEFRRQNRFIRTMPAESLEEGALSAHDAFENHLV